MNVFFFFYLELQSKVETELLQRFKPSTDADYKDDE